MEIGKRIREFLKEQGRTQRWLANELGIDEKTFSWKLTNNSVTADDLINIGLLLDINLNQLKEEKKLSMYVESFERDNIKWSVEHFINQINNRVVKWNGDSQGEAPWNSKTNSNLIHSILYGRDRIGLFIMTKYNEDGYEYDLLDGNMRIKAITDYINGIYKLRGIKDIKDDKGKDVNFAGFTFEELPDFAQKRIQDYVTQITYLPTDDPDEIRDMYRILQTTTPLARLK